MNEKSQQRAASSCGCSSGERLRYSPPPKKERLRIGILVKTEVSKNLMQGLLLLMKAQKMKNGKEFLLTDTVGFIQKLPTTLVAAFRATLEEISESSLLVHVVDISHPLAEQQIDAVDKVLSELDVASIPKLMVWNKIDKAIDPLKIKFEAEKREDTVCISAINGDGLDEFCCAVQEKLKEFDAGFIPMIGKTVFAMHMYCFWYMLYYSSVFGSAVIYILCGPLLLGCYYSQNNYGFCSSRVQLLIVLTDCILLWQKPLLFMQ
ncbi:hypothetical protein ACSBR2_034313 [Camellia fascicularis]